MSRSTPSLLMVTVRITPPEDPSRHMASDTAFFTNSCERGFVCEGVCVCVCVREREGETVGACAYVRERE